jgi:hypothetical protein
MNVGAIMLAGLFGLPLVAGVAPAAETGNLSLMDAAKLADRDTVRTLLNNRAKEKVPRPEAMAALIWAAYRNDLEMADLLFARGRGRQRRQRIRRNRALCGR